jgi:hypothetical protein
MSKEFRARVLIAVGVISIALSIFIGLFLPQRPLQWPLLLLQKYKYLYVYFYRYLEKNWSIGINFEIFYLLSYAVFFAVLIYGLHLRGGDVKKRQSIGTIYLISYVVVALVLLLLGFNGPSRSPNMPLLALVYGSAFFFPVFIAFWRLSGSALDATIYAVVMILIVCSAPSLMGALIAFSYFLPDPQSAPDRQLLLVSAATLFLLMSLAIVPAVVAEPKPLAWSMRWVLGALLLFAVTAELF